MSGTDLLREFGTHDCGADYILRPGGYAVIRRATGEVAVLATPNGYYLPGGGQNPGESHEQAAIREAREECRLVIQIERLIAIADQLVFSAAEGTHFRKRCWFYLAAVIASDGSGGEPDHVLSWHPPNAAVRQLSHESQRWAVATACRPADYNLEFGDSSSLFIHPP